MEIEPKQEDTEYLDMGDMDTMEDMGEAMGTKTGETGGERRVPGEPPGSLHKPPTTGLQSDLQSTELPHISTGTTDPEQSGCIPSPGI